MLAASYWSLLAPAISIAQESGLYGTFTFFPVSFGFALGALFVYMADILMPVLVWSEDMWEGWVGGGREGGREGGEGWGGWVGG